MNLGASLETMSEDAAGGAALAESGGSGFFLHPTALVGVSPRVTVFGQATLPVHQSWGDPADRERFRLGGGFILTLGY